MYGCESWTVKEAGRRRMDACELWCIIAFTILTDTLRAYYAPDALIFGPIKDGEGCPNGGA